VKSVCRRRSVSSKRWLKCSVKSVSSVREKDILRERKRHPPCEKKASSVREELFHDPCQQPNRGNLTYHAPPCGGGEGGGATILWAQKDDCLSDTDGENGHINRLNDVVHQALHPYCPTSSFCIITWLSDVYLAISFTLQCPSRSEYLIDKQTNGRLRPPMTGNIRSKARLLSIFIRTFVKSVLSLFRLFPTLNKVDFTIWQATEQSSFVPLLLCVLHSAQWGIRR